MTEGALDANAAQRRYWNTVAGPRWVATLSSVRCRPRGQPDAGRGQIAGGAAQGIGAALLEEFVYEASGQPQSVTLADYP